MYNNTNRIGAPTRFTQQHAVNFARNPAAGFRTSCIIMRIPTRTVNLFHCLRTKPYSSCTYLPAAHMFYSNRSPPYTILISVYKPDLHVFCVYSTDNVIILLYTSCRCVPAVYTPPHISSYRRWTFFSTFRFFSAEKSVRNGLLSDVHQQGRADSSTRGQPARRFEPGSVHTGQRPLQHRVGQRQPRVSRSDIMHDNIYQ